MTEHDLVRSCSSGDEAACQQLYELYAAKALRAAYGVLGDRQLAEDATQEAFIRAFRSLFRLRTNVSFGTWLYRSLSWSVRSARRRRRWATLLAPFIEPEREEHRREDWETRVVLLDALRRLPLPMREVLVFRFYLDLSEKDTAEALGCALGTVKSRQARALARLAALPEVREIAGSIPVKGGNFSGNPE